jgi:hypothetical protein
MLPMVRSRSLPGFVAVCCAGIGLTGCGEDSSAPLEDLRSGNLVVYEGRGRLQCDFTGGITPAQSAMKLTGAGVDVLRSGCGVMTGVVFAAVCGGSSGELLLHEIRAENRETAEQLGFAPAQELVSRVSETGYAWVDCQTGAILP